MRLYYHTVAPGLLSTLRKLMALPSLNDFVLVGGTNLALQRGHRVSIDIDLFSDKDYMSFDYETAINELSNTFQVCEGLDNLNKQQIGYHLFVGDNEESLIKLDLWFVDPYVFPVKEVDGIRLADIREIAAFKLMALTQRNRRQKDFWDINELLNKFTLKQLIDFAEKRYPYNFDKAVLLESLKTAGSVELAPEGIKCLRGNYWELIVLDLAAVARDFCND